jgi:glycosyltransferase involved in cell wall biosynthesis
MKILYILKSLEKGGAERFVIDLCLELNKRPEIEYKLMILQEGNDFEHLSTEIPFIQMPGPFIPSFTKKTNFDTNPYKKILEEFKPDIIHSHLFRSELYTSTHVLKDTVYVVHGHDNMKEFRNFDLKTVLQKSLLTNFLEKYILLRDKYRKNKRTYFIANSPHTLTYFKNSVPAFFKNNVRLIEYGFNFNRFFNPDRGALDKTKKLKLINVGRFAVYKNQKLLIEVARNMKAKGIEFEMNLLGVGEQLPAIQKMIDTYHLNNEVFLRGNINDVENWLNDSAIYLHSAYYEPFGLVLLEAMASGLPCLILNGKGNAYVVKNDFNGYIFDQEDPELFIEKITTLIQDKDLYGSLSKNAQNFAKTYAIEAKTDELLEFYKSVTKGDLTN